MPHRLGGSYIEPNWAKYSDIVDILLSEFPEAVNVMKAIGISYGQLVKFKTHSPSSNYYEISVYRRFYSSVILFSLIQEWPISKVISIMGTGLQRGALQQLQKDAAHFCSMIVSFCEDLHWDLLAALLAPLTKRLALGVKDELVALVRVGPEIGSARARVLYDLNIRTPADIVRIGETRLAEILLDSLPFDSLDPIGGKRQTQAGSGAIYPQVAGNCGETKEGNRAASCHRLANIIFNKCSRHLQNESESFA